MRKAFRKITAYGLLLIAALPLTLNLCLIVSQIIVQHRMLEKVEHANLVTIHINTAELTWTREGREASISGHLFDVQNYATSGETVTLTGLFDEDEDKLVSQLENAEQNQNEGNSENSLWFVNLMSCFVLISGDHTILSPILQQARCFLFDERILTRWLPKNTPPPKTMALLRKKTCTPPFHA